MVVDDEDPSARPRAIPDLFLRSCHEFTSLAGWGIRRANRAPWPGAFSAVTEPPWTSAIRSTIVRPSPVPLGLVVTNGSNKRPRISSLSPGPAVGDDHLETVAVPFGRQFQPPSVGHGIHGVEHEIEQGAANHLAIGRRRERSLRLSADRDRLRRQLRVEGNRRFRRTGRPPRNGSQ